MRRIMSKLSFALVMVVALERIADRGICARRHAGRSVRPTRREVQHGDRGASGSSAAIPWPYRATRCGSR